MTHVVHPYVHRLGGIRSWKSQWTFSNKEEYKKFLKTDLLIREFFAKELEKVHISSIEFSRKNDNDYLIKIKTSRAGMILGKDGEGVEKLIKKIKRLLKKNNLPVPASLKIEIEDVRNPEADAGIVAAIVKEGLEKKLPFRRVMKTAIEKSMASREVQGIKISLSGALGGATMARREFIKKGRIPLSTFRADIDYATARANLPLGVIGVKVWIYRGDIFDKKD